MPVIGGVLLRHSVVTITGYTIVDPVVLPTTDELAADHRMSWTRPGGKAGNCPAFLLCACRHAPF